MSESLAARRAHLLALRGLIDANGGGALQYHEGTMPDNPSLPPPASPLAIVALAPVSFALHATDASMSLVEVQGNAARSGQPTWARFVDGGGTGVLDRTVGPPGSGAQMILTDGQPVPSTQMYVGGEITANHTLTAP